MNLIAHVRSSIAGAGYRFALDINSVEMATRVFANAELDNARQNPIHAWLDAEIKAVLNLADYLHEIDAEPNE